MTLVGADVLKIQYVIVGSVGSILLPSVTSPGRQDELWRHTCFEAFFAIDAGYFEFNFSPSRHYAAYHFEGYREGMQPVFLPVPSIDVEGDYVQGDDARYSLTAWLDLKLLAASGLGNVGLTAVIEGTDGTKSYWALAHPPGPPDFHNPDCFTARLPAPDAP